jgi:hypothetical protein
LTPFFIEEMKKGALGDAIYYLIVESDSEFSVRNIHSVIVSNDETYLPRYFYGKKEDMKEALPKDRQIVGIYKQKPQLISAFPNDLEHQNYIAQLEEEMSYYVYMYKLPDGTLCTYDEHFNPKPEKALTNVGNFLEFSLTGEMTETQRKATEYALELWSEQLAGIVPVDIEVDLYPLGSGVLGMSFFPLCFIDPDKNIAFPSALWNQLVEFKASSEWDIKIVMNSTFVFFFGLDGNTIGYDYVTIMIHEVTHGLGFGCYCDAADGEFFWGVPGTYDCQLYQGIDGISFTELSNSERAALMVSNNLYSGAPNSNLLKANNGVRVKMYAPIYYSGGSSAHHWDNNVGFVNFMQYSYQYPLHTFNDRKIGILKDMGWETPVIDTNAVWVTFHANGSTGIRLPQPFSPGIAQNLKINSFSKTGYDFINWNTQIDETGDSYKDRESITIHENTELYAQWEPGTFTLTFYPNSGTVYPTSKQVVFGLPIGEMPIPKKPNYKFEGWKIGAKNYTEESIWTFAANNTFTAKWSVITPIEENQIHELILIFPNPTTGELRITSYELRITDVEIYDVLGRKVGKKFSSNLLEGWQPQDDGVVLDISNLNSGIYFLRIETKKGTVMKKIIKN